MNVRVQTEAVLFLLLTPISAPGMTPLQAEPQILLLRLPQQYYVLLLF